MALPSNLKVGNTYRFENKADTRGRSMNVYSPNAGTAPSLSNVCLWTPSNTDTEQQWVLKEYSGKYYLTPKSNGGVALDIYTGSASGQKNINAHLYARSSTSYIQIASAGSGYITMKSTSNGKYLTANQNNNGTSSGRTANSTGNVYWYSKLTDGSQEWLPVLISGSDPDPEPGTLTPGVRPSTLNYYSGHYSRFSQGQCTWHAYGRSHEVTGKTIQYSQEYGLHAQFWWDYVTNCTKSSIPRANSLAIWSYGSYGHVAYVEKVSGDSVYFTEANWSTPNNALDAEDGKVQVLTKDGMKLRGRNSQYKLLGYLVL